MALGTTPTLDDDNDDVADAADAFPNDATESVDTDGDTMGNNTDPDDDGDGVLDVDDAFPLNPTETVDTDGDEIGNNADTDDDDDGVADAADAFPLNPAESTDTDGDGVGNNADSDNDSDGVWTWRCLPARPRRNSRHRSRWRRATTLIPMTMTMAWLTLRMPSRSMRRIRGYRRRWHGQQRRHRRR